jgi:hypothetical protein
MLCIEYDRKRHFLCQRRSQKSYTHVLRDILFSEAEERTLSRSPGLHERDSERAEGRLLSLPPHHREAGTAYRGEESTT